MRNVKCLSVLFLKAFSGKVQRTFSMSSREGELHVLLLTIAYDLGWRNYCSLRSCWQLSNVWSRLYSRFNTVGYSFCKFIFRIDCATYIEFHNHRLVSNINFEKVNFLRFPESADGFFERMNSWGNRQRTEILVWSRQLLLLFFAMIP